MVVSFLTFGASDFQVLGLVFLHLGVEDSYVWGLVFSTFGG